MVLKGLSRLGVKRVTCTSHVYFPALMNGRENLHPLLEDLRAGLQKEGVEIELDLGAEYRVGEYMLSLIERGEILSGNNNRVLVEHNFLSPSPFFDQVVFEFRPGDTRWCWLIRSVMFFGRMISFDTGRS